MVTAAGPAGPLTAYEGNDMMEAALMGPGKTGFSQRTQNNGMKALFFVFFFFFLRMDHSSEKTETIVRTLTFFSSLPFNVLTHWLNNFSLLEVYL
jgi:hypothetical protein